MDRRPTRRNEKRNRRTFVDSKQITDCFPTELPPRPGWEGLPTRVWRTFLDDWMSHLGLNTSLGVKL